MSFAVSQVFSSDARRVSIITPSFNQAQFLEETILSVLNQDYANIEYIIIDGGSTDGSVEIIRRYASRLAFWMSEPDRGQADAINKGFRRATGEIVAWLNADDVYVTCDAVRQIVAAFSAHPNADIVYGDALTIDEHSYIRRVRLLPDFDPQLLLRTCFLVQPAVFMRARVVQSQSLDDTLDVGMDYKLWLACAQEFKFWHLNRLIAGDRNHRQRKTVSQIDNARQTEGRLQKQFGLQTGMHYNALRFIDKARAIYRRWQGIPILLALRPTEWAFDARRQSIPLALWDQLIGKDYQKV